MFRSLFLAAAMSLVAGAAQSSTVTISGLTIDTVLFADVSISVTNNAADADDLTGFDFTTSSPVRADRIFELSFTDNTFVNGAGFDLLLFENGVPESTPVGLSLSGPVVETTLIASDFSRTLSSSRINTWGIELSDFGIAEGEAFNGSFFLFGADFAGDPNAGAREILAAAAINGSAIAPVPLPAGAALMLTGLAAFGLARRRKA